MIALDHMVIAGQGHPDGCAKGGGEGTSSESNRVLRSKERMESGYLTGKNHKCLLTLDSSVDHRKWKKGRLRF